MQRTNDLSKLKYIIYIVLILALSFFLPRIIPGSPLALSETDTYILNQSLPEDTFNAFKDYYAPEKPLVDQFLIYTKHVFTLDLGYSFYFKMPVLSLILGRRPWTLFLSMVSLILSFFVAVPLAIKDALKDQRSRLKLISMIALQSIPVFILGLIIQLIFSYRLKWFPSGGAYNVGVQFFSKSFYADLISHSFLPLMALVIGEVPSLYIMAYNSAKKINKENYIIMANYLNIEKKDINKKFIFYNMVPEILGKLNIQFLYAITGSIFVESIFSYPGMGQLLKIATSSRDYPLMQGILLLIAFYGFFVTLIFESLLKKFTTRY
ncbi:ABC transporter permease [Clostridium sp. CF012]|uniref:ABC transporter permease n=1 Tax=Clostridium sp. CF012 TaxID=2843319 RepID=UPI001C0BA769|nr:ABC transporter permease [Clostridium sp. CF012]MBU3145778.1 ABC transporter permease [Clostridium sp. CF012]